MTSRLAPLRPVVLLFPLLLLYGASLLRLVELQGVERIRDRGAWKLGFLTRPEQPAPLGRILDRNGMVLAEDRLCWTLEASPADFRKVHAADSAEVVLRELSAALRVDPARLQSRFLPRRPDGSPNRHSVVARKLDVVARDAVLEVRRRHRGTTLRLVADSYRIYPQGRLLAHAVGHRNAENLPASGLERSYDQQLLGKNGVGQQMRVLWRGRVNPALHIEAPSSGADLVTTLDVRIAAIAHQELGKVVANYRPDWAGMVVLDPNNGDLLASVSLPDFDPNTVSTALTTGETSLADLTDHNLLSLVGPGSTFKPFVVSAALASGAVGMDQEFNTHQGEWRVGRSRVLHDVHPAGFLNPRGILVQSSNIGAAKVGLATGAERLRRTLLDIGFLGKESAGDQQSGLPPLPWSSVYTLPSISFGREFLTTPLRLAQACCVLANGGKPVRVARTPGERRVAEERVLPEAVSDFLAEALCAVVEEGTSGRHRSRPDLRIAGKTGTTERRLEGKYTSLFFGFAPAEEPKLLALVVMENPQGQHFGSVVAAPAAIATLERGLVALGELPAEPEAGRDLMALGTR